MKYQDIKTGIVYALKSRRDGVPIPMVVVSTDRRFESHYAMPLKKNDGTVVRDRKRIDIGRDFMCVGIRGPYNSVTHDELLAAAARCTLPEVDDIFDTDYHFLTKLMQNPDPRFFITFIPAKDFAGEYGPVHAEVSEKQEMERTRAENFRKERARIDGMFDRLSELTGLKNLVYEVSGDNYEVNINVRSIESLLGRVEAMRSSNPLSDGAL